MALRPRFDQPPRVLNEINSTTLINRVPSWLLVYRQAAPNHHSDIELTVVSSSHVEIITPKIHLSDGVAILNGNVRRAFRSESSQDTDLEVTFYDHAGQILAIRTVEFSPIELPARSTHPLNEGHYEVPLSEWPPRTRLIEAKAVLRATPRRT